jgi:16S rRNA (adenine1518-N6/adenine1519-N6)-dimethyltransferase
VAYFAEAALIGRVPVAVFLPRPKVESVLVEIERRDAPMVDASTASYEEIDLLLRAGFGGRRKMLRRSLAELVGESVFEAAGIDGRLRAEELDLEMWGKLVACRRSIISSHPQS